MTCKIKHPPYFKFKKWLVDNSIPLKIVAEVLNITVSEVGFKNNGYSDYSMEELNRLAKCLNVDLNMFKPQRLYLCSTFCSTKQIKPQKQVSGHRS